MQHNLKPTDEKDLAELILEAGRTQTPIEIVGGGSKRRAGRPVVAEAEISTRNLRGITLYEPAEMVISARAGTLLSIVEVELAKHHQGLAFEPLDPSALVGEAGAQPTIGGVVATNISGPRRVIAGAARDHVLGLRAINGRGEAFKTGGRVMKNVAGYDLCRGLSGSWGTLAVLTEVTLKAVPLAEETRTLLLYDQPDEIAIEVLCGALGLPYEVSAGVHLHERLAGRMTTPEVSEPGRAVTALRLENFQAAVAYRIEKLKKLVSAYGELTELGHMASLKFWSEVRGMRQFGGSNDPVWRISTSPKMGPRVVQAVSAYMQCHATYDWSGGLVLIEVPESADAGAADIRRVVATRGGHATLLRAAAEVRAAVDVFQPLEAGVERLSRNIKAAFDPARILNRGRMYADA